MTDMRLVVVGAAGRMGRMLVKTIHETEGCTPRRRHRARGLDRPGPGCRPPGRRRRGRTSRSPTIRCRLRQGRRRARFHRARRDASASPALAAQARIVHVVGTTGLAEADFAKLRSGRAARAHRPVRQHVPRGQPPRRRSCSKVARDPGRGLRHRGPRDASPHEGRRAVRHGAAARRGGGGRAAAISLKERSVRSRDGHTGARRPGDIGFATLRGGTVVGEHSVIFAGPGERIELTHQRRGPRPSSRAARCGPRCGAATRSPATTPWPTCSASASDALSAAAHFLYSPITGDA